MPHAHSILPCSARTESTEQPVSESNAITVSCNRRFISSRFDSHAHIIACERHFQPNKITSEDAKRETVIILPRHPHLIVSVEYPLGLNDASRQDPDGDSLHERKLL